MSLLYEGPPIWSKNDLLILSATQGRFPVGSVSTYVDYSGNKVVFLVVEEPYLRVYDVLGRWGQREGTNVGVVVAYVDLATGKRGTFMTSSYMEQRSERLA